MNNHLNKYRSITLGVGALAILCLSVATIDPALASEPSEEVEDEDVVITTIADDEINETVLSKWNFKVRGEDRGLYLRLDEPADPRRSPMPFQLIYGSDGEALCSGEFGAEAGQRHYRSSLEARAVGGGQLLILLTREPAEQARMLDAPVFQRAIVADFSAGSAECDVVAEGRFSELDGGDRLQLVDVEGEARLSRSGDEERRGFCGDGGYFDREYYDLDSAQFQSLALEDRRGEDTPYLEARLPEEPMNAPWTRNSFSWMSASSEWEATQRGRSTPRPRQLQSFEVDHAWLEGAEGLGEGEYVTAAIEPTAPLRGVRVFPGHGMSPESFAGFARPTRLLLSFSDGEALEVRLPEVDYESLIESRGLWIELEESVETRCLTVAILDAEPGDGSVDDADDVVAISGLTPYTDFDADTADETARRLLEAIAESESRRERERLADLGGNVTSYLVEHIDELLAEEEDDRRRSRAVALLDRYSTDLALPVLIANLERVDTADADYRRTRRAMASHGQAAARALSERHEQWRDAEEDERKYIDAIRLIGRIGGPEELGLLVGDLGEGSEKARRERVRAISQGGTQTVDALIGIAQSNVDDDRGKDALTTLIFIGRRHLGSDQAETDAAPALLEIYGQSSDRGFRMRLLEAMGYFPASGSEALLGDELEENRDAVIRAQAARSLRRYDSDQARQMLEGALQDRSPDVRIAAIRTLNSRGDRLQSVDAVIDYVRTETWPKGLHQGLYLLGADDSDASMAAIEDVIEAHLHDSPAATALRALRRGERTLPRESLEALLHDPVTPPRISKQLFNMLGMIQEDWSDQLLIDIANRDLEAHRDMESMIRDRFERRALLALGVSRSDRAADYLLEAIVDEERPIRARRRAMRALGFFHDPAILEELEDLAPAIDPELRESYRDALTMIQGRLSIDEAEMEIQEIMERIDELEETRRQ